MMWRFLWWHMMPVAVRGWRQQLRAVILEARWVGTRSAGRIKLRFVHHVSLSIVFLFW